MLVKPMDEQPKIRLVEKEFDKLLVTIVIVVLLLCMIYMAERHPDSIQIDWMQQLLSALVGALITLLTVSSKIAPPPKNQEPPKG